MKTVIYFLAIVALSTAIKIETYSVASGVEEMLEDIRDQMPCGFPLLGIGSLAPISLSYETVDFASSSLKIEGSVRNFTLNNLNLFDILELKHSIVRRTLTYKLLFKNITLDTWYDLETNFQKNGLTLKLNGAGINQFTINDLLVSGKIKYGINVINSRVSLKSLTLIPHIESVESNIEGIFGSGSINKKFNANLEKKFPALVNTFGQSIADDIVAALLPKINKFLYQYNLNDILAGAGGNSAGGEKIKCEL